MAQGANRRIHIFAHGVVQSVGFRWYAQRSAQQLGITGWVRNRPDGTVEIQAQGLEVALQGFVAAVRKGPWGGRVDRIESEDLAVELGETSFSITY